MDTTLAPQPARRLVGVSEAADYLGCATRTLRARIKDGTITAYRLGPRMTRIDLDVLDREIQAATITGGGE